MLQFITHPHPDITILDEIRAAVAGGCRWVQLRMKDAPADDIIAVARQAKPICADNDCIFVVDDHVEIAKELQLDGVHLGRNDMAPEEAREILGMEAIIGVTANTFDDVERVRHLDIDYIGVGPFRFTTTKKQLSPVLGIEGYAEIVRRMKESSIRLPIVAIGGITYDDIDEIMETGVNGIAMSGAIVGADDIAAETARIVDRLQHIIDKRLNNI